jgi:DNA invertase Pin-like site-specific DNA recombinase
VLLPVKTPVWDFSEGGGLVGDETAHNDVSGFDAQCISQHGWESAGSIVKAALYVRNVGTQSHEASQEQQLITLRRHAQIAGWHVVGEYLDHISMTREPLQAWRKMLAEASRRQFNLISVTSLDVAFRSFTHMYETLGALDAYGVAFQSLAEKFDTREPTGRHVLSVLSSVARFESESRSQRIRAGMTHARSKGRHVGRPPVTSRPEIRKLWPAVATRLETGEISIAEAARILGISKTTVRRLLSKGQEYDRGAARPGAVVGSYASGAWDHRDPAKG